ARMGQRARDDRADRAARAVDLVDRVVGHVADEEATVGREGEVVEIRRGRRDALLATLSTIDPEDLARHVVDGAELAGRVEVRGGRRVEPVGHDLEPVTVDVEADHLGTEPERTTQSPVRTEVEAVEPAEILSN